MYQLLSDRMGFRAVSNLLITNQVPKKARNQISYLVWFCLEHHIEGPVAEDLCYQIKRNYDYYKGNEVRTWCDDRLISDMIKEMSHLDCLDFIDVICDTLLNNNTFDSACGDIFKIHFNDVLISNSMGYIIAGTKLVPNTDLGEAKEIVIPSYHSLEDLNLDAASQHLDDAYSFYKDRRNSEAIISAFKAIESTVEQLLEKSGLSFDKKDKTATKVRLLVDYLGIEVYMADDFNKLVELMISPGRIRNRHSGHGSSQIEEVPDHLVKYEIDLVASNILFIARSYQARARRY